VRHPQVLVYETDGRLAAQLRPAVAERKWLLREPRRLEGCLRLLGRSGSGVVIVKAGQDLERELTVVERIAWLFPNAAVVFVGDPAHAALAGLAWDLGSAAVLFAPHSRDRLVEVVVGLMGRLGTKG
jgi:hypothetical protein